MKTRIIALVIASLALVQAAEKIKAPNGGRIVYGVTPHAEFLVTPEKKIEIRFLDDAGKVIAPATQTAAVVMGDRANPTRLAFTKDSDKLVSDKTVPAGDELPVVLQIKVTPEAKTVTEKFNLNMSKCPTCSNPEYACSCDHDSDKKDESHVHENGEVHKH